ncbi:MAG: hypothetical protein HQ518_17445 [Rhodopirellula sp.]|nr:hypothetical protein [Rhodopirellula sp.]
MCRQPARHASRKELLAHVLIWLILALAVILTLASATPLNENEPVATSISLIVSNR